MNSSISTPFLMFIRNPESELKQWTGALGGMISGDSGKVRTALTSVDRLFAAGLASLKQRTLFRRSIVAEDLFIFGKHAQLRVRLHLTAIPFIEFGVDSQLDTASDFVGEALRNRVSSIYRHYAPGFESFRIAGRRGDVALRIKIESEGEFQRCASTKRFDEGTPNWRDSLWRAVDRLNFAADGKIIRLDSLEAINSNAPLLAREFDAARIL